MRFAFLRAVNVGGRSKLPIRELVAAAAAAGLGTTEFLLQSGNLAVHDSALSDQELRAALEHLAAERFGVATRIVLRTPKALSDTLALNPYADQPTVYLNMWDEEPTPTAVEELARSKFDDAAFHIVPGAMFILYAGQSHTSKLTNTFIERKLGVYATARNLRTLVRMLERWPA